VGAHEARLHGEQEEATATRGAQDEARRERGGYSDMGTERLTRTRTN
jgi:hypothetical protein